MSATTDLLYTLLPSNAIEALGQLFDLSQRVATFIPERRLQGIYEVLEQRRVVTLCDPRGEVATVETVQSVRFRQNQIAALVDYVWGDGEILAEYRCSPGLPVDAYREGTRTVVLISLRELKNRGDRLVFQTHRRVVGGFLRAEECWETEIYHRTARVEVQIIFPPERPCQRATVTVQRTARTVALGPECRRSLPDGRQALIWSLDKPRLNERYRLRWVW
jgi:hypothetical protein